MADSKDRTSVTVRIAGEDHTIRTNAEPDYTRQCAAWVDDRITAIKKAAGLIEGHKAAILAALSITDELFQAQGQLEEFQEGATERAVDLARRLELALDGEQGDLKLESGKADGTLALEMEAPLQE